MSIVMQPRNTLLFNKNHPWVKKSGNEEFDVPIVFFDGPELCEIIGVYILTKVFYRKIMQDTRDYGLGATKELPGPKMERKQKQIFKMLGLSVTIKMNLHVVDFLDIEFNLKTNCYKQYMKSNSEPVYINKNSNYPLQVLKELPKTTEKRISTISSSKEIFDNSKTIHKDILKKNGF